MMQYRFDIRTPVRRILSSLVVYVILLVLLGVSVFAGDLPVSGQILAGVVALVLTMGMFMTLMQRFWVDGPQIRVRTRFGNVYTINCGEIVEICCSQSESTKQGPLFFITITTAQKTFTVDAKKDGFDCLAGYLLDQLVAGRIQTTAVSEGCQQMLMRYREGVFAEKRSA